MRVPVLTALRRVALGIAIVAAASAVLLLSVLQHRERTAHSALTKKHRWKIYFVQYNDVIDVKDAESGVLDGLRESGLEDGRDFEVKILNAQGDMATVSALIDSAVTGGADLLITFSTPTLQASCGARRMPVVTTTLRAEGRRRQNSTDHARTTGVSLLPSERRAVAPADALPIHSTLGCSSGQTNMVNAKIALGEAAKRTGFRSSSRRDGDGRARRSGTRVARHRRGADPRTFRVGVRQHQRAARSHLPVFAFQKSQAVGSTMVVVARDYKDSGRHAAHLAAGSCVEDREFRSGLRKTSHRTLFHHASTLARTVGAERHRNCVESLRAPSGIVHLGSWPSDHHWSQSLDEALQEAARGCAPPAPRFLSVTYLSSAPQPVLLNTNATRRRPGSSNFPQPQARAQHSAHGFLELLLPARSTSAAKGTLIPRLRPGAAIRAACSAEERRSLLISSPDRTAQCPRSQSTATSSLSGRSRITKSAAAPSANSVAAAGGAIPHADRQGGATT